MDLKHGRGRMLCKDGSIFTGSWVKDMMNGVFSIQKGVDGEKEFVLFKDGMRIDLSYQRTCKDDTYYILSVILFILKLVGVALIFVMRRQPGIGIAVAVVSKIIYLIYSCCTDSCSYLNNLVKLEQVFKNIAAAIKASPDVGYRISCYHYEERVEHYQDSKGNSRTRTR